MNERIRMIELKQWRDDMVDMLERFRPLEPGFANCDKLDNQRFVEEVQTKMAKYEDEYIKLKEATATLELALWKYKMIESDTRKKRKRDAGSTFREQCRINCGADIVIGHVLPYLLQ